METRKMSDGELLFQQWWTIELGRSMDETHEKELETFLDGYRYAKDYFKVGKEQNENTTNP